MDSWSRVLYTKVALASVFTSSVYFKHPSFQSSRLEGLVPFHLQIPLFIESDTSPSCRSERASRSRDVAGDSPGAKFSFNCFSSGGVVAEVDETILPVRGGGMLTEGGAGEAALLRGVVWVQRERLFARWKERFCILTRDYLHCFKKGSTQLTECGPFLFKVCVETFMSLLPATH